MVVILEHIDDILRHLDRHEVEVGWTHALLVTVDLSLGLARTQAKVTFIYAKLLQVLVGVSPSRIDTILLIKPVLCHSNQLVQGVLDEDDGLNVWRVGAAKAGVFYVALPLQLATWVSAFG